MRRGKGRYGNQSGRVIGFIVGEALGSKGGEGRKEQGRIDLSASVRLFREQLVQNPKLDKPTSGLWIPSDVAGIHQTGGIVGKERAGKRGGGPGTSSVSDGGGPIKGDGKFEKKKGFRGGTELPDKGLN